MPPGSAAIELFPYHFDHTLYAAIAGMAGVGMYPVHANDPTVPYTKDKVRCRGLQGRGWEGPNCGGLLAARVAGRACRWASLSVGYSPFSPVCPLPHVASCT